MNDKENVSEVWQLYCKGKDYNSSLDPNYYTTVETNERMAFGDQWKGVISNGLPTPQLNMFKIVINYMIAFLRSSKTTILYSINGIDSNTEDPEELKVLETVKMLNQLAQQHWEDDKIDMLIGDALKDASLTGDMATYTYWDSELNDFCTELVDGVNVMLGNPNDKRINTARKAIQPYVLIIGRAMVEDLKREAKENGATEDEINLIQSDTDNQYQAGERGKHELTNDGKGDKATYIIKLYKDHKTKTIHWTKAVKSVEIKKHIDTKMKLYPVSWGNWDSRKNSYHGQALLTGFVQNQIFVNKMVAMVMLHLMNIALPKMVYDKTRIASWSNAVGAAIGVQGEVNGVATAIQPAQMSNQILDTLQFVLKFTREAMGANEVLLGNVKPENTSAIVQVTQQSSIPLANQQMNLYDFIEQIAYIWLEFIKVNYGDVTRKITLKNKDGTQQVIEFNAGDILNQDIRVKIDVGPSSYWSEIASVNTMDNLLQQGVLDVVHYLERLPDGYIPNKDQLIADLQEKMDMEQQMASQEQKFTTIAEFIETLPPELQGPIQQFVQSSGM